MGHPIHGNTLNIGLFGQKLMPHWQRDTRCGRSRAAKTSILRAVVYMATMPSTARTRAAVSNEAVSEWLSWMFFILI
ncbi:MAG: hypothetical protein CME45_07550 [Halieaceae bacterium]|nr:hypothetical protein [Halieaceae bacterium]